MTETITFDAKNRFNETIFNILHNGSTNSVHDKCRHVEFIELCIFYQKMNDHNTNALKQLSVAVCSKYDSDEDVNGTINKLWWDGDDECLGEFMNCFVNL
jgi:hypothetical protein